MTQAKNNKTQTKSGLEIKTRKPKKKDADIFGNLGNTKKSTLPEVHPIAEILRNTQPNPPNLDNQPQPTQPTSPERNFSKVANSVTTAISEKLFKGLSKQTYDILYSRTRGAIKPNRRVTIKKKDLENLTGFSDNTLSKHLSNLKDIGLIGIELNMGRHSGSTYEVFIPDELNPKHPTHPTYTNPPQKVGPNQPQKVGLVGYSKTQENKDTYGFPKTFFKDFKYIDDEETLAAFLKMIDKLSEISEKLTGKKPTKFEADTWERLGDLLIGELLKANDKADSISNIPAFLTEVLRRKLINPKTVKNQQTNSSTKNTNNTGRDWGVVENKNNLPKEELEETLAIFLRNLRDEEGFENLIFGQEQLYSSFDWQWIIGELKKEGFENPLMKE